MPDRGALDDGDNERRAKYEARWARGGLTFMGVYNNLALDKAANDTAADFVREKIAEIVKDPETAKLLQPNNHPIGSKRICIDTDYFATFNRPNVTLVDIKSSPIEEILPNAVRTGAGDYEVDALVLATGFDAMTGSVAKIDIRGRNGQTLNQKWAEGPKTYLGLMSAGFPNLFIITGPGSPSVLSNMIVSIEQHVDWITDCIAYMRGTRPRHHGGEPGGRGQLGGACQRGRPRHALSAGQFLVHGRQHPGQAADLHALYRRRRRLSPDLQRRRGEGLRGLCDGGGGAGAEDGGVILRRGLGADAFSHAAEASNTTSSFRDAPFGAGPKSITPAGSMESQAHRFAMPRNDKWTLPDGQISGSPVQSPLQKYLHSLLTQITSTSLAIPAHTEGRFAIVTDVGQGMRWTRHVKDE